MNPAEDLDAVAARLEAGVSVSNAPRSAFEPVTPEDAVRRWVASRDMRRGAYVVTLAQLAASYTAHARESGWELDALPVVRLSRALASLGFRRGRAGARYGLRVDRETADALQLLAPAPVRRRKARRARGRETAPVEAPPVFPLPNGRARPLVTPEGRVYPSTRVAARLVRACYVNVQQAAAHGGRAAGTLWRYLEPDEVRQLPATLRAGEVVPWLAWRGTVAVHCPGCGARVVGGGQAGAGGQAVPTPQDSPLPPVMGPAAGSPTHI